MENQKEWKTSTWDTFKQFLKKCKTQMDHLLKNNLSNLKINYVVIHGLVKRMFL